MTSHPWPLPQIHTQGACQGLGAGPGQAYQRGLLEPGAKDGGGTDPRLECHAGKGLFCIIFTCRVGMVALQPDLKEEAT